MDAIIVHVRKHFIQGVPMRKGFTLVELIFVIVIIGILAAVAIPKYKHLKQNAQAASIVKIVKDAESAVPSSFANLKDLEDVTITDINQTMQLSGKHWSHTHDSDSISRFDYSADGITAQIKLDITNRELNTSIDCSNATDSTTKTKCGELIGDTSTYKYTNNLSF